MKKIIETDAAPAAIGPYSQATLAGGFLFTAGQIALDPESGEMVGDSASAQARQVMVNLTAVLEAGGAGWEDVVRAEVFLADFADFAAVNEVYGEFAGDRPPARFAIQAAGLPLGALVEIAAIAYVGSDD
ncbi:MAG: Rid family detoxifying hydrolase [Candidatus Zixiibacteriota bacterium]